MSSQMVSHADLDYFFYYQAELMSFLDRGFITIESIHVFLFYCNCNSAGFFKHYTDYIRSLPEVAGSAENFYFQLKLINQLPAGIGLKFNGAVPGIREQVATWLSEEIYFLEKKQQLSNSFLPLSPATSSSSLKVQTNLSVAHLSLAVKLLLDTGIIKNKNATEVIRLVAKKLSN